MGIRICVAIITTAPCINTAGKWAPDSCEKTAPARLWPLQHLADRHAAGQPPNWLVAPHRRCYPWTSSWPTRGRRRAGASPGGRAGAMVEEVVGCAASNRPLPAVLMRYLQTRRWWIFQVGDVPASSGRSATRSGDTPERPGRSCVPPPRCGARSPGFAAHSERLWAGCGS